MQNISGFQYFDYFLRLLGPKWGYPLTSVLEIASAENMELFSCGEGGVDPPERQVPPLWTNLGQWYFFLIFIEKEKSF